MKILSRTISEKTARIVSSIEKSVHSPVSYRDISERPNQSYQTFGTVDTHPSDGTYKVWLSKELPQEIFETNLLHELRHIIQIESGYSEVYNKNTTEFNSQDRCFIQEVGAHLSSVVLDIDVDIWLECNGYSQEHFFRTNYDNLIKLCGHQYTRLSDPLNFANLALALLHMSVHCDDELAQTLFHAYATYPKVVDIVSELRNKLRTMHIDTPASATLAHCLVIDSFNLWGYYYVASPIIKIRTAREYRSFLALQV